MIRRRRSMRRPASTPATSSRPRSPRSAARSPTSRLEHKDAVKRRADQLLVERGLAESRARAQALILAGLATADGHRIDKAGTPLPSDAAVEVKGRDHPWASRGGVKLAHALDHFVIDVSGRT